MDDPRILVIGAGVNGSVCAASLSKANIDEWIYLGQELERIVEKNGLAVPAVRKLLAYYQKKL